MPLAGIPMSKHSEAAGWLVLLAVVDGNRDLRAFAVTVLGIDQLLPVVCESLKISAHRHLQCHFPLLTAGPTGHGPAGLLLPTP